MEAVRCLPTFASQGKSDSRWTPHSHFRALYGKNRSFLVIFCSKSAKKEVSSHYIIIENGFKVLRISTQVTNSLHSQSNHIPTHPKHLPNNLLELLEYLRRIFPPPELRKANLNTPLLLIPLIKTKNKIIILRLTARSHILD